MQDIVVVANQTLAGPELSEELRRRAGEGPCRVHVVVPANAREGWTHAEGEAYAVAERRLEQALERLSGLGVEVDGQVGDERPIDAIRDALRRWPCDAIVLSTLPAGMSRWLGMDLVSRARRTFDVPVTHVEASAAPPPAGS